MAGRRRAGGVYVLLRDARIFNTRISQILSNPVYLTIYSNVIFPVGLMLMQTLLSVFYVLLMRYWYKNREYGLGFFHPRSKLASTNGAYPQYLLCLFIVGDVISNLLSTWGSATLDQTVQNLLMQLSLLFIVLFSMTFLGTRYKMVHYIACVLVVMSTLVAITTQVMFEGETLGSMGCATADPLYDLTTPLVAPIGSYELSENPTVYAPSGILYFALFALSTVPLAASNVFKQWSARNTASSTSCTPASSARTGRRSSRSRSSLSSGCHSPTWSRCCPARRARRLPTPSPASSAARPRAPHRSSRRSAPKSPAPPRVGSSSTRSSTCASTSRSAGSQNT
jgi:hypothetical protein